MSTNAQEIIEEIQAKAFQKGWNALAQKIMEAINVPAPGRPKKSVLKIAGKPPFREGTTASAVYDYVKSNPGMRGVEIVKNAGVEDKPGRTALHRMKLRGIAVNESGKWRVL